MLHWCMTTRIGDETRARIATAWPDLIQAMAAGEIMAPHYEKAKVSADQVRVWRMDHGPGGLREAEWQAARQQSADAYADRVVDIANNPGSDGAIARVRMDAFRWLASKRNPHAYSDKSQVDVNVRTIDLTRILSEAQQRLSAARAVGRVVEGEVLRAAVPQLSDLL